MNVFIKMLNYKPKIVFFETEINEILPIKTFFRLIIDNK